MQSEPEIEHVFREESGRILATLIRGFGDFDLAEEVMQDAFAEAVRDWPNQGVPANPGAWITTVARRKGIDRIRRQLTRTAKQDSIRHSIEGVRQATEDAMIAALDPLKDDPLRLIFTCCHPALALEAQVALTLRLLGGLTTREIARAFLLPEAALSQRIVRAKRKIRDANIPYRVPPAELLSERVPAVLAVLYLVFNEGYSATSGDHMVRRELCMEAIRLARNLTELMPDEPEVLGLLALMLLQNSRRATRQGPEGELILLEQQDRSRWDRGDITDALSVLDVAMQARRPGPYQLQAAIAAVHGEAAAASETDWAQIVALYGRLYELQPSAVIALNRAVAVAMADGCERGLELIDGIEGKDRLADYHLFHAARADLLRRMGRLNESARAYRQALRTVSNAAERTFLERRLKELEPS